MKIIKILIILAVGALCTIAAALGARSYSAGAAGKGDSALAEAILRSQLEEQLARAAEKAAQEVTIVTTVMETKPPVTEPPVTITAEETTTTTVATTETTTVTTEDTTVTTAAAEEEIITEYTRGGLLPEDRSNVPTRSMFTLTEQEQELVIGFLVEHYFLDGHKYADEETRPALKEKKQLAAEMEDSVIESYDLIMNSCAVGDIASLMEVDYSELKRQAQEIRDEFAEEYKDAGQHGEQFEALYEDSLRYFDRLIQALEKMEQTAEQYKNAENALLAIGLLTSAVNNVIIPEVTAVLEQSFDLVETSQEIFLEGTQGTRLLTREEVKEIIENPGLALYVIENEKQETG